MHPSHTPLESMAFFTVLFQKPEICPNTTQNSTVITEFTGHCRPSVLQMLLFTTDSVDTSEWMFTKI